MNNSPLKESAYTATFTPPVSEIKRKWHSIRSAFSRELRMRNLYTNVGANEKRQWKHFNKLMFLQEGGQVEMEEEVEGDYTIHLVEQVDASSGLLATNPINQSINQTINQTIDSPNQTENVTAVLNMENGHSSPGHSSPGQSLPNQSSPGQTLPTQTNKRTNKKRKTNPKSSTTNGGPAPANTGAYEQIIASTNFDPIMMPRNSLIGHNHYPPQPLSEEEIFGHSIAASLKKFDAKQKEIVKLRLQEVIVQHLTENS